MVEEELSIVSESTRVVQRITTEEAGARLTIEVRRPEDVYEHEVPCSDLVSQRY